MNPSEIIALWLAAVQSRGQDARFAGHASATLVVRRYGYGARQGEVVQQLHGWPAIASWLATAPDAYTFSLGPNQPDLAEIVAARYVVRGPDGFVGGGVWRLYTDPQGAVAAMDHEPDDLPLQSQNYGLHG
jgi:hypothetical protein